MEEYLEKMIDRVIEERKPNSVTNMGLRFFKSLRASQRVEIQSDVNNPITVKVGRRSYCVQATKSKIAAKHGIPVEKQRVLLDGRDLPDNHTLIAYNLRKNVKLRLAIRVLGGAKIQGCSCKNDCTKCNCVKEGKSCSSACKCAKVRASIPGR